ncbi:MAG: fibrobacter succinogenes major paralogous domain-containing protein, partial [Acholeplasma sp.]|nr:fibrobacter succinogenes major paralogous domain-containing protein [Acholeplasma sp.]
QLITKNEFGSDTIIKNNHLIVNSQGEPISDIDGNIYQTVIIGDQEWMAENLKVIHYRNGDDIPNRIEDYEWNNALEGAYCWYNNDINWKDAYGALYNWLAVTDNRQLCPEGWHISTKLEWTILTDYLGGIDNSGGKLKSMKAAPDNHPRWDSPNTGSTNESGFSGLPGGSRSYYFKFDFIGKYGSWWTSTEQISGYAWSYELSYISIITANGFGVTNSGYSVRCVKD